VVTIKVTGEMDVALASLFPPPPLHLVLHLLPDLMHFCTPPRSAGSSRRRLRPRKTPGKEQPTLQQGGAAETLLGVRLDAVDLPQPAPTSPSTTARAGKPLAARPFSRAPERVRGRGRETNRSSRTCAPWATSACSLGPATGPLFFFSFLFNLTPTWKPTWAGPIPTPARPRLFSCPGYSFEILKIAVKFCYNQ
jgi:hypothetical protein